MRTIAASILLVLMFVPLVAGTREDAARQAAESWVALLDAGKYGESWDQAATMFRGAVKKEQWTQAAQGVRGPLGKLISRKFKSAQYTTSLPGAPDGEYVVLQFESSFENKKAAVETITPMKDKDGGWRVSGYFIR